MSHGRSLERGTGLETRPGSAGHWLRTRRVWIALSIAVIEGIVVALVYGLSKWVVVALAIATLVLYLAWGRSARSDAARQLTWIMGASQALAVVVVIFAFIIDWLALIVAAFFAGLAFVFLFRDRGSHSS